MVQNQDVDGYSEELRTRQEGPLAWVSQFGGGGPALATPPLMRTESRYLSESETPTLSQPNTRLWSYGMGIAQALLFFLKAHRATTRLRGRSLQTLGRLGTHR